MPSITQRKSGWWQAKIRRKGHPVQSKTFPSKELAEDWATVTQAAMIKGTFIDTGDAEKTTLAELIKRYREDVLPTKRGKHFEPALKILEENLGKQVLTAISSKKIAELRDKRLKAGLSASTVRKEINLLSKLIDLAGKEWGIRLPFNPCAMVSRPAEKNTRERRLAPDEEKYLLAACNPQMAIIVRLAVQSAARLGELLSLRWLDVDLERQVMTIRGIDGRGTKNDDAFRSVPLSPKAVAALEELKALPRPKRDSKSEADTQVDRVFPWWKAADSFNKSWVRTVTRAQASYLTNQGIVVPSLADFAKLREKPRMEKARQVAINALAKPFLYDLRFHDCRHEATSRLFELGIFDSMEVATITGHKTLAMLKRYTHLKAEDLAKRMR